MLIRMLKLAMATAGRQQHTLSAAKTALHSPALCCGIVVHDEQHASIAWHHQTRAAGGQPLADCTCVQPCPGLWLQLF